MPKSSVAKAHAKKKSAPNRRGTERASVAALLPVSLTVDGENGAGAAARHVTGCVFDVSEDGMCVILREELATGSAVTLLTLHERLPLVVTWVTKDADRAYRCGLSLSGSTRDLRTL